MSDFGEPPVIPDELRQYDSYATDPKYQIKFTIVWCSVVAASIIFSLPYFIRSIGNGTAFVGFFGISEDVQGYVSVKNSTPQRQRSAKRWRLNILSWLNWTPPGLELNAAQIVIIIAYFITVILCIVLNSSLVENANRAGFIALAQFPPLFLFATKNSIVSLLLGPGHGYEKLNYIHRWLGRGMFIAVLIHGALWIRNHVSGGLPILGEQKEVSGIAAFGVLCILVLSSVRFIRRLRWEVFWAIHILGFVAFYITVCYHTIYAAPWIFPPLAFYGFDLLLRFFKYRIKDAILTAVDTQLTRIQIPHCNEGWTAGQHLRLRVFIGGRIFESHPLTIMSAPMNTTCLGPDDQGILLAARVKGDWTKALNDYAKSSATAFMDEDKQQRPSVPVHVLIDGPYGGSSVDLGNYESVLLFAGGSGVTFTLGLLDDIVGRCVKLGRRRGERTRRIEFSWCVRSFGHIEWIAPQLLQIARMAAESLDDPDYSLHIHVSVYVTCLCNPEAIPPIPNTDVVIARPTINTVLSNLLTAPSSTARPADWEEAEDNHDVLPDISEKLPWFGSGGGVALCASGPEALTREAANAVARLGASTKHGPVGLHTELFAV